MTYEDTLRLILQNAYNRKENLVQINNQATLAIPTILAAIWGIEGGLDNFRNAWILSIISIGLVLVWRYFAHYIDDDIAKIYIEIVKSENRLGVPENLSFFYKFMKFLTKNQKMVCINDDAKVRLLEYLNKKELMGFRGHDKWDKFAAFLVFVFAVSTICQLVLNTIPVFHPHHLITFILMIKIAFFVFSLFIGLLITGIIAVIFRYITRIQKDPDIERLQLVCPTLFNEKKE
jgi:hypothetical protein